MTLNITPPRTLADLPETPTARWDAACRSDPPAAPLDDANFQAALLLYEQDGFRRGEIEARILGGQSQAKIAQIMDVPESVLPIYRSWFFDVWPRLLDDSWIHAHALGRQSPNRWKRNEVAAFWRWFAYTFGCIPLDALLRNVTFSQLERSGLEAYLRVRVILPTWLKLLIAGGLLPELQAPEALEALARFANLPDWEKDHSTLAIRSPIARMVLRLLEKDPHERREILIDSVSRRRRQLYA